MLSPIFKELFIQCPVKHKVSTSRAAANIYTKIAATHIHRGISVLLTYGLPYANYIRSQSVWSTTRTPPHSAVKPASCWTGLNLKSLSRTAYCKCTGLCLLGSLKSGICHVKVNKLVTYVTHTVKRTEINGQNLVQSTVQADHSKCLITLVNKI